MKNKNEKKLKKYYKWLHQHIININNKIKTMGGRRREEKKEKKSIANAYINIHAFHTQLTGYSMTPYDNRQRR